MAINYQGTAARHGNSAAGGKPGGSNLVIQTIETAFQHHQAGRIREAESCYQQALAIQPGQIDALYYLGVLYLQNGVNDAAEEFLTKSLRKQPKFAEGHHNLGVAYQNQGKLKEAAKAFGQAIKADKRFAPAQLNLGNVYLDLEQFERAASVFSKLVRIKPDSAQAHLNLGRASKSKGDPDAALAAYLRALELQPNYAEAHLNIGAILLERDEREEAMEAFQQAASFDPKSAEAYNNIGVVWKRDGHLEHAMSCFARASEIKPGFGDAHNNMGAVLYAFGDREKAEAEVRKGIELAPDSSAAYCILGKILRDQNRFRESVEALNTAISLAPDIAEPYREMGATLADNHQHEEALRAYSKAVERDSRDVISLNNIGMSHVMLGRLDSSVEFFSKACEVMPNFNLAHSNKLFSLNYADDFSPEDLAREHFAFGKRWDRVYDDASFTNPAITDRPLKIGYVSPDFRKHVLVYFIEEVLKAHDRQNFEVFCYAEVFKPDHVTERLQGLGHHWRSTIERNPSDIAQQIRDDGIDILIDLAGHTGNNRLPVFGLKPAPVQVTWIGYPNTTGMKSIDYILTTPNYVPEGSQALFREEIYYLPRNPAPFNIPDDVPDICGAPYEKNGYVTFGCFNNSIKVTAAAIDAWSEVLRAVPDSRLLLKSHSYRSQDSVAASKSKFESRGVDPERIICEGPSDHREYLSRYSAIDLAFDPFPYNGGTTTMEVLFMGVPLLALEGKIWASRNGSAMLRAMGEESLIASSVEDYIAKAIDFARNPAKLAVLRQTLHDSFMATGVTDPVAMTRDVENAYRDMWNRWCEKRNAV